ncbi:MAG: hypothetical protein E6F97_08785 [Actinobacteria bacterium]|nr:MAG: hypothetical protein E6F97_08785 [Actinomycetota bacterium]
MLRFDTGTVARTLPTAALVAAAAGIAWLANGSTSGPDWLPYALLAGLLLAVVLASSDASRPRGNELVALGALVLLAGWAALSISWSAVPPLARDEALLTLFYAIALAVPLLTLRTSGDRELACGAVASASGLLAIGSGIVLRSGGHQLDHFYLGRLSYPISYPNALAAVFLIGFWPAVVLASRRTLPVVARMLALATATAIASGWLTAQSKGGIVALAASAALVFGLSPMRLRLLPPTLIAAALSASAYRPLTAPFRTETVANVWSAGSFLAAVAVLVAVFFARVYHPGWLDEKWRAFTHAPSSGNTSSHLFQLGSYRYDIWRVAVHQFEHHPLAGIGSRGFGPAYLQNRHSPDTPARAHSVELDALSELGVVGFALLLLAIVPVFVPVVARMRARDPAATAAFAGGAYWLVHASVDWIWTVPACGVPFFLLLGAGNSGGERRTLARRAAVPAAVAAVLVALVLFVPPWLSARLTDRGQIHWAKRLDPLSVDPYVAEAARAPTPRAAASLLAQAVRKEPRVVELRFDLGLAYQRAHELRKARAALLEAKRLDPRELRIDEAFKSLPKR